MGATHFSGRKPEDDPTAPPTTASIQRKGTAGRSDVPTTEWYGYDAVYIEHHEKLYKLALLLTGGNRPVAEDIVSDVFLRAFEPWAADKIEDFGAYARRAVVYGLRSRGRHASVVDRFVHRLRADDRGDRDLADQATDRRALHAALAALPPGQRAAVVLRYYEAMSVEETAQMLGVTSGTVKSQVSDALRSLRRALGESDGD